MFMTNKPTFLSLFLLLSLSVAAAAQTPADKAIAVEEALRSLPADLKTPRRYALLIGASDYSDKRIPNLPACANDVNALHTLLTDPGIGLFNRDHVTVLTGKDVTPPNVKDALDQLARKAGGDDLVLVFFSGHGATDERGRAYWVMADTQADKLRATGLPESDVSELLGEIKTKRLVTLIDACYSAATANVTQTKSLLDLSKIYPDFKGDGRIAITASKGDQLSIVISDPKHPGKGYSAFAWHVIEGLKGTADGDRDGVITVDELWGHVKDRTEATARAQGGNQQPQLKGQFGSKFLLTIDADRLQRNLQETAQSKALRQQRLKTLSHLYLDGKVTLEQTQMGQRLLEADPSKLDENDLKRLAFYAQVLDGELTPDKLQRGLDLIETPTQRQARLAREAAMKAEAERLVREAAERARTAEMEKLRIAKMADLWNTALANDNKTSGRAALAALEELLKLDPSHGEAKKLRDKITGYFGPPTLDLGNGVKLATVHIKAGRFTMGSPASEPGRGSDEAQKSVTIALDFYMGESEVTQAQWKAVMGTTPWKGKNYVKEGDDYPATYVSWDDAQAFMEKVFRLTGKKVRLPSEAEWEYACRAGTTTAYSFGDSDRDMSDYAWYGKNAADIGNQYAHQVKTKRPNPWGLYDMHGNLWELCEDRYDATSRVLRGGGWGIGSGSCRSATRNKTGPSFRFFFVGFRVVLDS